MFLTAFSLADPGGGAPPLPQWPRTYDLFMPQMLNFGTATGSLACLLYYLIPTSFTFAVLTRLSWYLL